MGCLLKTIAGQYSKNLFAIEENNLVYREDNTVNFERFEMLIAQIRNLQLYQRLDYIFHSIQSNPLSV